MNVFNDGYARTEDIYLFLLYLRVKGEIVIKLLFKLFKDLKDKTGMLYAVLEVNKLTNWVKFFIFDDLFG